MLMTAVAVATDLLTPLGTQALYTSRTFGVLIALAGFGAMTWAWWQFKTAQVAICPTAKTERLITTGIYTLTRNPMYLGMTMMLLGAAVWFGTLPFYLTTVCFFLIVNRAFCPYEEAKLTAAFGKSFSDYTSRVRRWL
jgi:protein-S-isoprenylcysteine O-methyltransferase Ste14